MPKKVINESIDKSYHEVTPTLPFRKEFTEKYKLKFLKEYVLNKERLLKVLPVQMKHFTESELNQRYASYFPRKINGLKDVLKIAGIKDSELKVNCLREDEVEIVEADKKINSKFPVKIVKENAFRILLINISTHFSKDKNVSEYDVLEPPLGLIALQSFLNRKFKENIRGMLIKSRVDFDNYEELSKLISDFNPDMIGVSAMTFHKDFFHDAIANIRKTYKKPIVVGGPHPTTSYTEVLKDKNIDINVIGEGENTLSEIVELLMNKKELNYENLSKIPGIAFDEEKYSPEKVLNSKKVNQTESIATTQTL